MFAYLGTMDDGKSGEFYVPRSERGTWEAWVYGLVLFFAIMTWDYFAWVVFISGFMFGTAVYWCWLGAWRE